LEQRRAENRIWLERQRLQQESLALTKEETAWAKEEEQVSRRLGSFRRGGPRDPTPYLLPLVWGAALCGLGWLFGRNKPAANESKAAEQANAVPPAARDDGIPDRPRSLEAPGLEDPTQPTGR
jgi:hypothetical protein